MLHENEVLSSEAFINEFSRFPDLQINTKSSLLSNALPMASSDFIPFLQWPDRSGFAPDSLQFVTVHSVPSNYNLTYILNYCAGNTQHRFTVYTDYTQPLLCGAGFPPHHTRCGRFCRCWDRNVRWWFLRYCCSPLSRRGIRLRRDLNGIRGIVLEAEILASVNNCCI